MKLLLVEDELLLQEDIRRFLADQGYICEIASTLKEGEKKVSLFIYDLVILDVTLPGGSGMELLKQLKSKNSDTGVLILSAKDSLADKLVGLNLGADDYLTKPFYMEELNARINAIIRRRIFKGNNVIRVDKMEINTDAKSVHYLGNEIALTKKEFELLLFFVINKNRVVSKQSILTHLWGDAYDATDSLDTIYVHTMNLRKKLMTQTGTDYIKTVYGMGYKWVQK
ncbi:MAG: response regulator transcription factor [Agriterribacter sp.]